MCTCAYVCALVRLCTSARLYTSPPVARPRPSSMCPPFARPVHTLRVSYGFTRSFGDEKTEREKKKRERERDSPRWHGSRAPLFGFSCARGSTRERRGEGGGALLPLSLFSARGEGVDSLAERNTETLHNAMIRGGEWGGERESPNAADGFVGNARLRDASRGTGVGRARRRLDVGNEWGAGHWWRLTGSANRALSPGVFYPAIYAEDGEDGSPCPPVLPAHRSVSLAPGRRALSVLFARALPVRPSAQERTLSFRDPLRQHACLSPRGRIEKCRTECCSVCIYVLRAYRSRVFGKKKTRETIRSLSLVFERQCSEPPRRDTRRLTTNRRARWCARVEYSERARVCV